MNMYVPQTFLSQRTTTTPNLFPFHITIHYQCREFFLHYSHNITHHSGVTTWHQEFERASLPIYVGPLSQNKNNNTQHEQYSLCTGKLIATIQIQDLLTAYTQVGPIKFIELFELSICIATHVRHIMLLHLEQHVGKSTLSSPSQHALNEISMNNQIKTYEDSKHPKRMIS